ncbi:MAG TPA: alkaline phosphatase family protein [Solirubrobacterales bacterium]|nr:alkaline phosphatase family protein [Solirubrobacterales bacterium]
MIAVIQFDAASAWLLDRLEGEGRLPNLAELRERGTPLELETPAEHFPASAYQDLYRGVEVGDHGLFYPFQWGASDQRIKLAGSFEAPPPIWDRLGRRGRSTLAIDPYECHRPHEAQGAMVCGWGMRERVVLERWSIPDGGDRAARRRHGRPPDVTEVFGAQTPRELRRLRERFLAAPARVADLAIERLRERSFDLAWIVFAAPHLAGHRLWEVPPYLDEGDVGAEERQRLDGALAEVYEEVDRQLGRVLEALPDDCDVIACSVLGMDVNTSRADLLPGMLHAVLAGEESPRGSFQTPSDRKEPRNSEDSDSGAMWRLRAALSGRVRAQIAAAMPDKLALNLTARLELRGVDWSTTRAFAHPADNQGYVHLNRADRERDGIVGGSEATELVAQIREGLLDFRDPDGEPAVVAVDEVGERWQGAAADRLPDLVVRWRPTSSIALDALHSPRFGTVRRQGYGSGRTGNHTDGDAWAILAPRTGRPRELSRPARVTDIPATVAALEGVPLDGLAGEPLIER